jgi:hypothetical protein
MLSLTKEKSSEIDKSDQINTISIDDFVKMGIPASNTILLGSTDKSPLAKHLGACDPHLTTNQYKICHTSDLTVAPSLVPKGHADFLLIVSGTIELLSLLQGKLEKVYFAIDDDHMDIALYR